MIFSHVKEQEKLAERFRANHFQHLLYAFVSPFVRMSRTLLIDFSKRRRKKLIGLISLNIHSEIIPIMTSVEINLIVLEGKFRCAKYLVNNLNW